MFASKALKSDFVTVKINVTVVLLDIDILKDTARIFGHQRIQGWYRPLPRPYRPWLCQAGAGQTNPPRHLVAIMSPDPNKNLYTLS